MTTNVKSVLPLSTFVLMTSSFLAANIVPIILPALMAYSVGDSKDVDEHEGITKHHTMAAMAFGTLICCTIISLLFVHIFQIYDYTFWIWAVGVSMISYIFSLFCLERGYRSANARKNIAIK